MRYLAIGLTLAVVLSWSNRSAADYPILPQVCEVIDGDVICPPDLSPVYSAINKAVGIAEACLNGMSTCPVPLPDPSPVNRLVERVYSTAQECLNGAPGCPAPQPPPPPDPSPVYNAINQAVAIAEACLNGTAVCPVPSPDPSPVYQLQAQVYATAQECLNGAPGCPAPQPPPPPDLSPVYSAINQAVAIGEACLNGTAVCPVPPPDPSPVYQLVAQVYSAAQACLNGSPGCPAPQPPPPPDLSPVYNAINQAVAIAQACLNSASGCPVPPPDPSPVYQLVAQVYSVAQACLDGAPGCPAYEEPGESSVGLGGYRICATTDFNLVGHLASGLGPILDATYTLQGNGTAQCTKDPSGASGWVTVTLSFSGTDQRLLPCTMDSAGTYFLTGPFTLNDGSVIAETEAALTITTTYVDLWTRSIAIDFDLPDVAMRSSLRVFDLDPPLRSADPRACMSSASESCPLEIVASTSVVNEQWSNVASNPVGALLSQSILWVRFGIDPSLESGGLLYGTACYQPTIDRLDASGTFDVVQDALEVAAGAAGTDELAANLPSEVTIDRPVDPGVDALPPEVTVNVPDESLPGAGAHGQEIAEDLALALVYFIETLSKALVGSTQVPSPPDLTDAAPYLITVRYKTAAGNQTMEAIGIVGVTTTLLVPNGSNSGLPEPISVTITRESDAQYSLVVERGPGFCLPFPVDVLVSAPPLSQLQQITDIAVQAGFEGLSFVGSGGGGAPKRFELRYSQSSSSSAKNSSATINMIHCFTVLPIDVVARYQSLSEETDLQLRMHMPQPVTKLFLASSKGGKKRTVTYNADRQIERISLTGMESGFEFNARLDNVAPNLNVCSDRGSGCVAPWRVYVCGCDAYEEVQRPGWWTHWLARRMFRRCTKPVYCPIPSDTSVRLTSTGLAQQYSPTTLNLTAHNPEFNQAGALVSDTVSTVSNFIVSQLAYDSWLVDYPKRVYLDTRDQIASGTLEAAAYDGSGGRTDYTKAWFDPPGITAWNRQATLKKHNIRIFGVTVGHYYSLKTSGGMNCMGEFHIDTGGKFASWQEDWFTYEMCGN